MLEQLGLKLKAFSLMGQSVTLHSIPESGYDNDRDIGSADEPLTE